MSRTTAPSGLLAIAIVSLLATVACSAFEFRGYDQSVAVPVPAPDSVDAVVFLIGDAGEAIEGRSPIIEKLRADVEKWSAALERDSAVSVVFLGDNVYPSGVHNRSDPRFPQDSAHLWAQISLLGGESALRHNTVGHFMAGNHDWGNFGGDASLERIRNLESLLAEAREQGPRVALLPAGGHAGPVVRDVGKTARLIFFDSHWFLRGTSERATAIFLKNLRRALDTDDDRHVVMLAHHPFASSGPHGVVASGTRSTGLLYLLQRSGTLVQDLNSPAYGSLRDRLRVTFEQTGVIPLVFAGGHDHSLQVLDGLQPGDPRTILVSGAGSKLTQIGDTVGLRFGAVRPGYMTLIFRSDESVDLFVVAGDPDRLSCPAAGEDLETCMSAGIDAFSIVHSERLPTERPDSAITEDTAEEALIEIAQPDSADGDGNAEEVENIEPNAAAVPPEILSPGTDTVVASPGEAYRAGFIERILSGDLNRHLWGIEFPVPILDLDSVGGGLTPTELSGGKQTLGLRLEGEDGFIYQFRSIVKDASRALPPGLRSGPVDQIIQDQMAAQFPLSAVVVADLLQSIGVLVARPTAVVMPDDPRLGEFRELFAGRMGWIEVRPDEREDDDPGFAGSSDVSGTDGMLDDMWQDPEAYVNTREFVRARLIDMFVNDWDRHQDNWRWAKFDEADGRERWDPIPRDRDWALARIDGLLPRLAGMLYPKYVSFDDDYPSIKRLMWAGAQTDRYLLGGVGRDVFVEEALNLQRALSDSVIDHALNTLPAEYLEVEAEPLRRALGQRRDGLVDAAEQFYELLAGAVDAYGTFESDSVALHVAGDSVTISLWRGEDRLPGFSRTYHAAETDEVRVRLQAGEDVVSVTGDERLPLTVRLIGEPAFVGLAHGDSTRLLIEEGTVSGFDGLTFHPTLIPEPTEAAEVGEEQDPELPQAAVMAWETRDWGSQWLAYPTFDYTSDVGLDMGMGVTRYAFGFRQDPWESLFRAKTLFGLSPDRVSGVVEYQKRIDLHGLSIRTTLTGDTRAYTRFFGIGNNSRDRADESFHELFRSHARLDASLLYESPGESWSVWIGPRIERWGELEESLMPSASDFAPEYGSAEYVQAGIQAGIRVDGRDALDMPTDGAYFDLEARAFPELVDLRRPHGGLQGTLSLYRGLPGPLDPALHVRLYGERVWGDAPWPDRARLGGRASLPGYPRFRFLGDGAASASALVRASLLRIGVLGGIRLGGHGIATVGRVWLDGVEDGRLGGHVGLGGGFYTRFDALERSAVISFVKGESGMRTYIGLGFPF